MKRTTYLCLIGVLLASYPVGAQAAQKLQDLVAAAKPGQTIELPAGEFIGGVTLPEGVSLKGAGVDKTILDAKDQLNGLSIEGGSGAVISDLTIRNARGAGVLVKAADATTLARVRTSACVTGFQLAQTRKARLENCIADQGSYGIVINNSQDPVVVNSTVANCPEMGISLAATRNAVIFNNCIAGTAVCLNIDDPANVQSDYNLYFGLFVGRTTGQIPKNQLTAWQYVTALEDKPGLDRHSVSTPLAFTNVEAGDFTTTTIVPWALDRAATQGWGTAELAGAKAPTTDAMGTDRAGRLDVGAVLTTAEAPRPADGEFKIARDEGVKSAGVFTKDGMLVTYLFHNLPLRKGTYSFWLPARDYVGQSIPTGDYEIRVSESDFQWKYMSHIGDTGPDAGHGPETASANPGLVAFATKDTMVMLEGWSEGHTALRSFDIVTGKLLWSIPGGSNTQGLVEKDGTIYFLYDHSLKTQSRLTRVDVKTGKIIPWKGAESGHMFPETGGAAYSMAALGDRLYIANADLNKLIVVKIADGTVEKQIDVAAPKGVAGDEKTKTLWVISNQGLLAIDAAGTKVAESNVVPDPAALSACEGKLAVASAKTGKIHILDAADPKALKELRTLGLGDGPYGKMQPDRFFFQKAPGWSHISDELQVSVALDAAGNVGLCEAGHRVSVFDAAGKNLWSTYGLFGNASQPSYGTDNKRFWDMWVRTSFVLDEKTGKWDFDGLWDFSAMTPKAMKENWLQVLGDFKGGDNKAYIVAVSSGWGRPADTKPEEEMPVLLVGRLDDYKAVPVYAVHKEGDAFVARKDTNGDGRITTADAGTPVTGPDGKPLPAGLFARFNTLQPDGSVISCDYACIWKPTMDAQGVPTYEGKDYKPLPAKDREKEISPYDFKPEGIKGFVQANMLSDGGYITQSILRASGGTGLSNAAGTDLVGYGPDGRRRWVNQMANYHGIAGLGTADDITATAIFHNMEVQVMDADGLGLGAFCETPKLHYTGYWIDHPNLRLFKMSDGHVYFTNGDNSTGRHPWYRLENQQSLLKARFPVPVSAERAAALAAIEFKPVPTPVCPQPRIKAALLEEPMTVDGGLEKWRKAGIRPQILMGPGGKMKGPGDCSALVRIAYEGQNLYFQVLTFDDVPVFGNWPVWQNSVEIALNGVWPAGMQFVAGKKTDAGPDVIWRNRFFDTNVKQIFLPPDKAPCVVKVLEDAKDVSEREMLESLYGVDLAKAKVIVTEFMIPITKETYVGAEKDVFELGPGKSFWFNIFVDDSDSAYTDEQRLIGWPTGSGMFNPKEQGAYVTCE